MSNLECTISVGGKNLECVTLLVQVPKGHKTCFLLITVLYILYELWKLIHEFRL
jgi:hypothetical protein